MIEEPSVLFRFALGAMGCGLMYVAMCRFAAMSKLRTLARIRHAALGLFVAGVLMVGSVTVWPGMLALAALSGPAAALGWMAATSHAWRGRQPLSAERGAQVVRRPVRAAAIIAPARWGDAPKTRPMSDAEMRRVMRG